MAEHWAHKAANEIWDDLSDRKGVGNELEEIDKEVKSEIIDTMAQIIRKAAEQPK